LRKKSWFQNILWLCFCIFMLCASFAASYILMLLIYRFTGKPSEPWGYFIYSVINLLLIAGVIVLGAKINDHNNQPNLLRTTLEALEKIAQGNFDVFIEQDERGHFNEVIGSINKMAKELGGVEQLRQDFISNISHEFQSPLTSISGYAALLRKDGANLKQLEYATIIEEESKRLSKLSENLLRLSALEAEGDSITKALFRLDRQLENVVLLLEPQWKAKNIIPETSFPKMTICGNEDLLKQVWINLLVNAIKFTPENGEISVSLIPDGKHVNCVISDNGIGIAPSDQIHIFERFYKVDKSRDRLLGGNGLGLALVKKIVNIHEGDVTVDSVLGKGTAFKVKLPINE
jgi:two-component system, OmpR family, phosphate regulon sensor histidine kinase PhoR